ncbi:MAG: AAA family ATPase [Usitatibacteraceae bacterium]
MLIEYIRINNWRSFYGENDFVVSTLPEKNVTLIRAENGVGKTSLLAAINWCFFGILPAESEFEDPTSLVNKFAIEKDGAKSAIVSVDFAHEGRHYRATRRFDQANRTVHALKLIELVEGGEVPSMNNPDRFVNSVIPKEMAPHFFFYGEATSRYTGATGAKKFGEAVKGILGSTVARMALGDLRKAMDDYNKQASDSSSGEAQAAERRIEEIGERVSGLKERVEKLDDEIAAADDRIERLNRELAGTQPAKNAQERREKLEAQFRQKDGEKDKAQARAQSWMPQYATALLSEELIAECAEVLSTENTRRKLPAPYDKKFVDELLEDEECICGTKIEKGTVEYEKVKSLLDTAGDEAVMARVMSTEKALGRIEVTAGNAWDQFRRNSDELGRIEGELRRLDADIEAISKELSANPATDIAQKEAARELSIQHKRKAFADKADLLASIKQFEAQRAEIIRQRDELVRKSEAAKRFVKRAQLAGALTARLQARLAEEEEGARAVIENQIDAIVKRFMRKPAQVRLDKDYQLRLFDEDGSEVAKSTGENQLLGLAFTGAIANYAKERQNDSNDILLPGTVAPLVVDSPFGHLDPLYRKGVAEFLPELAPQVILLVSTSQASDIVLDTLGDKIGSEYVLARHNRADGNGKPLETIAVRGRTFDMTVYGSEFDGTRIVEIA